MKYTDDLRVLPKLQTLKNCISVPFISTCEECVTMGVQEKEVSAFNIRSLAHQGDGRKLLPLYQFSDT